MKEMTYTETRIVDGVSLTVAVTWDGNSSAQNMVAKNLIDMAQKAVIRVEPNGSAAAGRN